MGTMTGKLLGGVGLLLALGCAGKSNSNAAGGGGTGGGSTGGGSGGEVTGCVGSKPAVVMATGRIDIPVRVTANHVPMTVGVPGTGRDGREYRLSLLKLFLAEPAFIDANGHESKAQFVGAGGPPLPYGLALIDADDPATQLLRLTAPPGAYTALHFGVGVPAACNAVSNTDRVSPLNPDSDMFWTWGSQFMFIRAEGASRVPPATEWSSFEYHVGYDPSYANITVAGSITVGAGGAGPTLSLDVDRMLTTDAANPPSPKHTLPDGWVVDNLENQQAFSLE